MHHYPFHVGDYASHTQHLDELEDLAYRRMLDYIYLNEINLPESVTEISRLIRMRTHCERIATVLREFFMLENGEWINKRAADEIAKYKAKSGKARESASKRWEKCDANALRTHCEGNANQNQNQNQYIHLSSGNDVSDKIDHSAIIALYHKILPELPVVKIITDKRKAAINGCASLKTACRKIEFWEQYFTDVRDSEFLMGRKTDWRADFDFLTTKSKFVKIIEGSYSR